MTKSDWSKWANEQHFSIERSGQWRSTKTFDAFGPSGTLVGEKPVISFASNDYLGLSHHPKVIEAAREALERWGTGSGASRLVVGTRPVHEELETALATWKQTESAVLFPTGYAANLGVLTTFGGPGVRICSDELNHASIIDGCRLSGAEVRVYRHRDIQHLHDLLVAAQRDGCERTIVVSDTVFSMDGDIAALNDLTGCCARHGSLLILDEAHSVLGPNLSKPSHESIDLLQMGTLSKTLGSLGGFIAGPRRFTDLLVNRARSFIFTTASTPADTAAALAALEIVTSPEGEQLRKRLRGYVARVRPDHPSPIIPIILGSEKAALAASEQLLNQGLWVPAIRPPTVPPGTSRLRVALSASHQDDEIDLLISTLSTIANRQSL
ncbi:MAG: aminotransferase class I/II-fold pyridoxal phosphate-dependent enzyme [Acidimicrobiales bacterium]